MPVSPHASRNQNVHLVAASDASGGNTRFRNFTGHSGMSELFPFRTKRSLLPSCLAKWRGARHPRMPCPQYSNCHSCEAYLKCVSWVGGATLTLVSVGASTQHAQHRRQQQQVMCSVVAEPETHHYEQASLRHCAYDLEHSLLTSLRAARQGAMRTTAGGSRS